MNGLGSYIKQKRRQEDITLRQFAKQLNVSPAFICALENSKCNAKEETIIKMAEILGEDKDYLLAQAGKVAKDIQDLIIKSNGILSHYIRDYFFK